MSQNREHESPKPPENTEWLREDGVHSTQDGNESFGNYVDQNTKETL